MPEKKAGWKDESKAELKAPVQKKLAKGKTIQEIADDLEETVETIQNLIETLQ